MKQRFVLTCGLAFIFGACAGERTTFDPPEEGEIDSGPTVVASDSDEESVLEDSGSTTPSNVEEGGSSEPDTSDPTDPSTEPTDTDVTDPTGSSTEEPTETTTDEPLDSGATQEPTETEPTETEPTETEPTETELTETEPTETTTDEPLDSGATEVDPPTESCGDGVRSATEDCDDGNDEDGDGCAECQVTGGWECLGDEGEESACSDFDECDENAHDCDPNATCVNEDGGYDCVCNDGYGGDGQSCVAGADCASGTLTCDQHATCEGPEGDSQCVCDEGWDGDGVECEDIDECSAAALNDCHSDADCEDLDGAYDCDCKDGFEGDGFSCTNIDECDEPGLNDCSEHAFCDDEPGTFECECLAPYVGNGVSCTCPLESANNVLVQAGFDTAASVVINGSGDGAWSGVGAGGVVNDTSSNVLWSSGEDADGCDESGSLEFQTCLIGNSEDCYAQTYSTICVQVQPGTTYSFGFMYKRQQAASIGCQLIEYESAGCTDTVGYAGASSTPTAASVDSNWSALPPFEFETQAATHYIEIGCSAGTNNSASMLYSWMDKAYLNAVSASF